MTKGRSIRLFLVDGSPTGILTAEIMNWTGSTIVAPRTRIVELVKREEVSRTGVYFLVGPDPDGSSKSLVYIGESDNVKNRIIQHNEKKDFWTRVCIVTSKDTNLTKAHVRYLESRLITMAQQLGRATLDNVTSPPLPALPEADISDMEFFMEQVRTVLPVLGMEFLRDKPAPTPRVQQGTDQTPATDAKTAISTTGPTFVLDSKKHGLSAEAQEINGEFVVLAGSTAQADWIGETSGGSSYGRLHKKLVDDGTLPPGPDGLRQFKENTAFNSPSAAAATIFGRPSNGRVAWKIKDSSQTYAQWQDEQLAATTPEKPEGVE